jgi:uncharacterized protein YjbI with pentapeptide repeats
MDENTNPRDAQDQTDLTEAGDRSAAAPPPSKAGDPAKDAWESLVENLGAQPPADAAQRRRPAVEHPITTVNLPGSAPLRPPGDWNALAADLGIEVRGSEVRGGEVGTPVKPKGSSTKGGDLESGKRPDTLRSVPGDEELVEASPTGGPRREDFDDVTDLDRSDAEDSSRYDRGFPRGDLSESDLEDSRPEDDDFEEEALEDSDLEDSDLEVSDLEDSDLGDSDLGDSDLEETRGLSGEAARSAFESLFEAGSFSALRAAPGPDKPAARDERSSSRADDGGAKSRERREGDAGQPPRTSADDRTATGSDRANPADTTRGGREGGPSGEGDVGGDSSDEPRGRRRRRRGRRRRGRDREQERDTDATAEDAVEKTRDDTWVELDADDALSEERSDLDSMDLDSMDLDSIDSDAIDAAAEGGERDSEESDDEKRPRRRRRRGRRRRGGSRNRGEEESAENDDSKTDDSSGRTRPAARRAASGGPRAKDDEDDVDDVDDEDLGSYDEPLGEIDDDDDDDATYGGLATARSRGSDRNGRSEPREEEDDEADDADDDVEEGVGRARGSTSHRNIPSWQDALSVMIESNLESRKNSPSRPSRPRGRGRGRGGRGSKRS